MIDSVAAWAASAGAAASIASFTARAPCDPPTINTRTVPSTGRASSRPPASRNSRRTGLPVTTPTPGKKRSVSS